jgi:hypothetical protein
MKKSKVRFNLGKGKYYLKWKIEQPGKPIQYVDPEGVQIVLRNCELKNNQKTANKIFEGSYKSVCAWVLCESVEIKTDEYLPHSDNQIRYNPKIQPYWMLSDVNVDKEKFNLIVSEGRKLFV